MKQNLLIKFEWAPTQGPLLFGLEECGQQHMVTTLLIPRGAYKRGVPSTLGLSTQVVK